MAVKKEAKPKAKTRRPDPEAFIWLERYLWEAGVRRAAGVDEVGRGPLAGPVVAAAVIFPQPTCLPGVNDSKMLAAEQREELEQVIRASALCVGIGEASVEEIDRLNILKASFLAMKRAIGSLCLVPDYLLLDGNLPLPDASFAQLSLVQGDARCLSIAAASIIAKVHRDRLMRQLHEVYPQYGFDQHKGYATPEHVRAIRHHGQCPVHRRSFQVKELLDLFEETDG